MKIRKCYCGVKSQHQHQNLLPQIPESHNGVSHPVLSCNPRSFRWRPVSRFLRRVQSSWKAFWGDEALTTGSQGSVGTPMPPAAYFKDRLHHVAFLKWPMGCQESEIPGTSIWLIVFTSKLKDRNPTCKTEFREPLANRFTCRSHPINLTCRIETAVKWRPAFEH